MDNNDSMKLNYMEYFYSDEVIEACVRKLGPMETNHL